MVKVESNRNILKQKEGILSDDTECSKIRHSLEHHDSVSERIPLLSLKYLDFFTFVYITNWVEYGTNTMFLSKNYI